MFFERKSTDPFFSQKEGDEGLSSDDDDTPEGFNPILRRCKKYMKGGIDGIKLGAYVLANYDAHFSEFLADCDRRLEFVSGFTGPAGFAVIFREAGVLWTDDRYYNQASSEVHNNWIVLNVKDQEVLTEVELIAVNVEEGSYIGADARIIPHTIWTSLAASLSEKGLRLCHVSQNLVDLVWKDKPEMPNNMIVPQIPDDAGRSVLEKLEDVRTKMEENQVDFLVLNALDEIAWMINARGNDVPYCPFFFSYLVIGKESAYLFVDELKIRKDTRAYLIANDTGIEFHSYERIYEFIKQISANVNIRRLWISPNSSMYLYSLVPEIKRFCELSPVSLMKAVKNDNEISGMYNAHVKDGIALVQFFCWLEREIDKGYATELLAAQKLEEFRQLEHGYMGPSFPTTSAATHHASFPHFTPTEKSNMHIQRHDLYLCDSGGHYIDGTTDMCRTFCFGMPSEAMKEYYTLVFQGFAELSTLIFPKHLKARALDTFGKRSLWKAGLDYSHMTGHGIGSYGLAHEGPISITSTSVPFDVPLEENMFIALEPGFYSKGRLGVRLENVVQVVSAGTVKESLDQKFLALDAVTLCPIQTKMLKISMLKEREKQFVNEYHAKVREKLLPILKERHLSEEATWLERNTDPI